MKIKSFQHPSLILSLSEEEAIELNLVDFLNYITPDLKSRYRKLLEPGIFGNAFVKDGMLVWEGILEATMCGGDKAFRSAEFSEKELRAFKKEQTDRNE